MGNEGYATFKIPPFVSTSCCFNCFVKKRMPKKGATYPVVSIEDAPEVNGGKRVTIRHDCGATSSWCSEYFQEKF